MRGILYYKAGDDSTQGVKRWIKLCRSKTLELIKKQEKKLKQKFYYMVNNGIKIS